MSLIFLEILLNYLKYDYYHRVRIQKLKKVKQAQLGTSV
jgi:hypothetical protein